MKIIRAQLTEAYQVHKTYTEFLSDVGDIKLKDEILYSVWPQRLTDPSHRFYLITHAKKIIGMVWGKEIVDEPVKTVLVEGRFLRRAYRGKFRFTREIIQAERALTKDFARVLVLLRQNHSKISMKYKPIGVLVEKV